MAIQAVRGTSDLLGDDVKRWSAAEHATRRLARLYGYQELRTPVIEDAGLFLRSLGETTDLIQKEMFQFKDRGDHDIVLRPEGTAPVVRAYLEHNLHKTQGFAKLFYLGPMFRAERPQAGRFRQFHQFGVEAIGSASPWVDVEVITLCHEMIRACGVADATIWIASMGCRDDQQRSAAALRERLATQRSTLCKECQARFEKNVFRVLDCKNPDCRTIAWSFKGSPFLLCEACTEHFDAVRRGLKEAGVAFDDTTVFARGLDYYTRTVFEVRAKGLGSQDAVAAGGRYDQLVEELGGPPMGAFGFAAGIERVLLSASSLPSTKPPSRQGMYLATATPALVGESFRFAQLLRTAGVVATLDYDGRSLKAQLREADKAGCRFVAILGEQELKSREITVKDLEQGGAQESIGFDVFAQEIAKRLKAAICH
ncbi:MAG: histidine--tRNA ligase [Candidatus Omnitrophota bacterium]|nr:histidine--tRNA ligase [Candidatus Omnitrophota bacterium]